MHISVIVRTVVINLRESFMHLGPGGWEMYLKTDVLYMNNSVRAICR